jgi:hypothetical protein
VAFVRQFQPTIEIPLEAGKQLLCFHGSPHSFNDLILPDTPDDIVRQFLGGFDATLLTGGHTHTQQLLREHAWVSPFVMFLSMWMSLLTSSAPYYESMVEGFVNKVKWIKRSSYGQAGFPLLQTGWLVSMGLPSACWSQEPGGCGANQWRRMRQHQHACKYLPLMLAHRASAYFAHFRSCQ